MKFSKNTSPKGGKKACLCEDGSYSSECCKGELINQGIGTSESQSVSQVVNTNAPRTITSSN
jgi:hypothetical protein